MNQETGRNEDSITWIYKLMHDDDRKKKLQTNKQIEKQKNKKTKTNKQTIRQIIIINKYNIMK